jgi:hypothetical protein
MDALSPMSEIGENFNERFYADWGSDLGGLLDGMVDMVYAQVLHIKSN